MWYLSGRRRRGILGRILIQVGPVSVVGLSWRRWQVSVPAEVELVQFFMPWVAGPHGFEYFTNGTKVLFHRALLDWYPASRQKAGTHSLCEDLEKGDGISDALEVGWDSQPFAELAPLASGGKVFLADCGIKYMQQRLQCSV